jgi:DNA mismatch endonuclease, patch repair protein
MADVFSKKKRSQIMAAVKSKGNKATEIKLASILRRNGIKGWRRHLPIVGKPDFTFGKEKVAVFVDGCFWHGCPKCYALPKSRKAYWAAKVAANQHRDKRVNAKLKQLGWTVLRFWECSLRNPIRALRRLQRYLEIPPKHRP